MRCGVGLTPYCKIYKSTIMRLRLFVKLSKNLEPSIKMRYLIRYRTKILGICYINILRRKCFLLEGKSSNRARWYPKEIVWAILILIRLRNQPSKNLNLVLSFNSILKEVLRKLIYLHLFLIKIIDDIINLVISILYYWGKWVTGR